MLLSFMLGIGISMARIWYYTRVVVGKFAAAKAGVKAKYIHLFRDAREVGCGCSFGSLLWLLSIFWGGVGGRVKAWPGAAWAAASCVGCHALCWPVQGAGSVQDAL